MVFHQDNLNMLKCSIEEWQSPMTPRNFAVSVFNEKKLEILKNECELEKLCDKKVIRNDVFKFIGNPETKPLTKVLFVLAWGGMRTNHAKQALLSYEKYWKNIVVDMLAKKINRRKAYESFHCLVKNRKLRCMGPAYFTKLIYFLEPNHNGYIMDQWTARSMNLLSDRTENKIHLIPTSPMDENGFRKFRVDPKKNDVRVYNTFCKNLECLAKELGIEPDETEKLIFSKGGTLENMGCWRRFVLVKTSQGINR